jgi:lipopolysaccharide heptosyltransferase II
VKQANTTGSSVKQIIVRGTNWVGDAVMTIPALRALRAAFPDAEITLATRSWSEGIFADADFIDKLLIYDRDRGALADFAAQVRKWKKSRFDMAILFQNAFEAAAIAFAARVPERIGYATDGRGMLLTQPLSIPHWRKERHEVYYYLNIVAGAARIAGGHAVSSEPEFNLQVSESRRADAYHLLERHGLGRDVPLIALCPGSTNSRAKRWPSLSFAQLADLLVERTGAQILLIGAKDEFEVSTEVASAMKHKSVNLTGATDLAQAVALLSICDALVSNDTGPAHIAAALEKPVAVIFGPTDPATTRPFTSQVEVIRKPPECAPCMLRDCPIDHRCMTAISPEDVLKKTVQLLDKNRSNIQSQVQHGV